MEFVAHETKRLLLRRWKESDREPFASMNRDPDVMAFFDAPYSRERSDQIIDSANAEIAERGYGFWAVERKDTQQFIGFVGLHHIAEGVPFSPIVEVGWRLAHAHWGQGFATEGAKKCLAIGFNNMQLDAIFAITTPDNLRSKRVMAKIGLVDLEERFFSPSVPTDSKPLELCLFKIERKRWQNAEFQAFEC